jgi:hypothetical protein
LSPARLPVPPLRLVAIVAPRSSSASLSLS